MKKIFFTLFICFSLLFFGTCSSNPRVSRVDPNTVTDISGFWNDTDVRLVCERLINESINSPRVAQFIRQYASQNDGRLPAALVGTFANHSSEHIDTSIISIMMESAIFNSGRLNFVTGGAARQEIRDERQDQQSFASEATAAALGYETGAALLLTGSVRSIVERAGNTTVRSYFVNAELINIETNELLWRGLNDDIKKIIRQPGLRL